MNRAERLTNQAGGGSRVADAIRVARAIATNQLARHAPRAYLKLTGQTGRGAAEHESAADIAGYFRGCLHDYFQKLAIPAEGIEPFLRGKVLLEYGPGDLPGVAALMVASGAEKVFCVDRFPMVNLSEKNARVLGDLIDGCSGTQRERLLSCLADRADPRAGFDPRRIEYIVAADGLSQLRDSVDFVFSRAVLEHVNDLAATFDDMVTAMRLGALAIHQVDLQSHGLHRTNPLDFLAWSPWLWHWMYSEKGVPNRWRVDEYRRILAGLPVRPITLEASRFVALEAIGEVRPQLPQRFRQISDADLSWLGFWLVFERSAP